MPVTNADVMEHIEDVRKIARWFYRRFSPPCTIDDCLSDAEFALIAFAREQFDPTRLGKDGEPVTLKDWCMRRVRFYLMNRRSEYGQHSRGKTRHAELRGWTLPEIRPLGDAFDVAWPERESPGGYIDELMPLLKPSLRVAVRLRMDGHSLTEAGAISGCSPNTIRANCCRGLKELREMVAARKTG